MGDIYHAGEVYAGSVPIDDTQASEDKVYSSAKVESMMEEVQSELTAKLKIRDSADYTLPRSIAANSIDYVSSTIDYQSGDICFCRTNSANAHLCQPYIGSNGKWACVIDNIGSSSLATTVKLFFTILNT